MSLTPRLPPGDVGEGAVGQLAGEDFADQVDAGEVVRVGAGGVDDQQFPLEGGGRDLRPGEFFLRRLGGSATR